MTLRERLAKALYDTDLPDNLPKWENISPESREWFMKRASSVLQTFGVHLQEQDTQE